jgi:hypothetical protein
MKRKDMDISRSINLCSGFLGSTDFGLSGTLKGLKSVQYNAIARRLVMAHIKRPVVAHLKTLERAVALEKADTFGFGSAMLAFCKKSSAWLIVTINTRMGVHP